MALELLQAGIQPLGQFDGYDNIVTVVKGGEVGTIVPVEVGQDRSAKDADGTDGYVDTAGIGRTRPAVTNNLTSGDRPLYLIDDGLQYYGTLFGSVLGATVGQTSYGINDIPTQQLGPHTATGSGKLTLWDKPGTYAVTLDACDTTTSTGLTTTNTTLQIGDALYATSTGLLTPDITSSFETGPAPVLARFLNFETWKGGSLVTTPTFLVSAVNSPVGQGQPQRQEMYRAIFQWAPPIS
jgi:hypothetical protein